jgi:hypothetical protein
VGRAVFHLTVSEAGGAPSALGAGLAWAGGGVVGGVSLIVCGALRGYVWWDLWVWRGGAGCGCGASSIGWLFGAQAPAYLN